MTWLPVDSEAVGEREAVLGLQPEGFERLREALDLSWSITDPALLELCRQRMAAMFECRAELSGTADEESALSDRERAALEYADQFVIDQNGMTWEQRETISRHLSQRELCNFVQAVNVHDGHMRVLTLLDVAPDPAGPGPDRPARQIRGAGEEEGELPGAGLDLLVALTDPAFWEARMAFGGTMALQSGVDPVTTEICRLRNANHQTCRY